MDIGFFGALLGGVLTLLSPCSVMLLPAFFSYAFASPREVVLRTGVFYLGLITTLVPLGVLAGSLGALLGSHRTAFVTVAAVIVIVLGAVMVLGLPWLRFPGTTGAESTSSIAVYALGTVYGLAGACAGPLLGAVLALAALGGNALYGGVVLLFFAAGMALPLLVLALLWSRLPFVKRLVRPREIRIGRWRNTWSAVIGGVLTMGIGVLLLMTEGTAALSGVLGATDQARLEDQALGFAAHVPDLWVVAIVLAAGGTAISLLALRRRRLAQTTEGSADAGAVGDPARPS